jgi:hypothetical protein
VSLVVNLLIPPGPTDAEEEKRTPRRRGTDERRPRAAPLNLQ